jgi:hypothetical protein
MVSEGTGRLFRRKDGKYLIYLPTRITRDSMFPFKCSPTKGADSVPMKISLTPGGDKQPIIEKSTESSAQPS